MFNTNTIKKQKLYLFAFVQISKHCCYSGNDRIVIEKNSTKIELTRT